MVLVMKLFRDGLTLGVGTTTGQVLLYDLRASKPLRTKDHMYGLPIKKLDFHKEHGNDLVLSMDAQVGDYVFFFM